MKRAASLLPLAWVLGALLLGAAAAPGPVEWVIGEALDLRIEQVVECVQLGFMFGGFRFDEAVCAAPSGPAISTCVQLFFPRQGLKAIESGWPVARIVFDRDRRAAGGTVSAGRYLAIVWLSDCRFFVEGRWFLPRTPVIILVRESDLGEAFPGDDRSWHVMVPSVVIPLGRPDDHLTSVRCGSALDLDPTAGTVMMDLELWDVVRLIVKDTVPGGDGLLTVPTADELYPAARDASLHEALFAP